MKRIFSMLIVCLMVFAMSATVFAADCNFLLTLNNTNLTPGDVVVVTVKLDSNPGMAYVKAVMNFNASVFERVPVVYTNEDDEEVEDPVKSSWGSVTANDGQSGKTIMVWSNASNKTGKTFATLWYKVKSDAPNGTYSFTLEGEEIKNANFELLDVATATSDTITVTGGTDPTPTDKDIAEDFKDNVNLSEDGYYAEADEITSGTVSYGDTKIDMGANGKVHTFFAKTATGLKALEYGVTATINGNEYFFPGKADVEAGKAWAIKIVIPEGKFSNGTAAELTSMAKYVKE